MSAIPSILMGEGKAPKALAVLARDQYGIATLEIDRIIREHQEIVNAELSLLPRAIKIGEWFLQQRPKFAYGTWKSWLKETFPNISYDTIALYGRLGAHRNFLENTFHLNDEKLRSSQYLDLPKKSTSINQARQAIDELEREEREAKKRKRERANQVIDVEAKKVEEPADTASEEAQRGLPMYRPLNVLMDPATNGNEAELEKAKQEEKETHDWNDRERSLDRQMKAYIEAKIKALTIFASVVEWIQLGEFDAKSVSGAISRACLNTSGEVERLTTDEIAAATKLDLEAGHREYVENLCQTK